MNRGMIYSKTIEMLNDLNDEGVLKAFSMVEYVGFVERYQAATSPERLAELQAEREAAAKKHQDAKDAELKQKMAEYQAFLDENEAFFKKLDKVHAKKYGAKFGDVERIYRKACRPDGSFAVFEMIYDAFRFGFLKGVRSERARKKLVNTCGSK